MLNNFYHLNYSIDIIDFLASLLLENKLEEMADSLVVFPGKRPALYLRKKLSEIIKCDFLPPKIYSIDEFVSLIVQEGAQNFSRIDEFEASLLLYNIIKDNSGFKLSSNSKFDKFSKFFYWGIELYGLFEEFLNACIGEIELNSLKEALEFEEGPEEVFFLWQNIEKLYKKYQEALETRKFTTGALEYFKASSIKNPSVGEVNNIYLAGFYVLTESQKTIFKNLSKDYNIDYIVQGEEKVEDTFENLADFFNVKITEKRKKSKKTSLFYYPSSGTQNEMVNLRSALSGEKELDSSAVVLPKADLLFPFLWEVAQYLDSEYNISLEYPLKRTPFFNLIELLIELQDTKRGEDYFAESFISVLSHPYVKNLKLSGIDASITRMLINEIINVIRKKRLAFFSVDKLKDCLCAEGVFAKVSVQAEQLKDLWNKICGIFILNFAGINSLKELFGKLERLIYFLAEASDCLKYYLTPEFLQRFLELFIKYRHSSPAKHFMEQKENISDLFNIFRYLLTRQEAHFTGTPLKGFQVLGPLEVRNIKFKKIFYLDLNEGVIPPSRKYEPLISPSLRKSLGLATYRQREMLYRYYVRSSIFSSDEAHLFYQTGKENIRSRFLEELIWAQEKEKGKLVCEFPAKSFHHRLEYQDEFTVKKTQGDISKLISQGFSPTSIDTYLECPLAFYFKYVAGLIEADSYKLDSAGIGRLCHQALEKLITKGQWTQEGINKAEESLPGILNNVFLENYPDVKGEILIVRKLVERRLFNLLETERNVVPVNIIGTEKKLEGSIKTHLGEVLIKGKLDRIEKKGNILRVIDYKTGLLKNPDVKKILQLEGPLERRIQMLEIIKSFQLPLYLYLAKFLYNCQWNYFDACLISLRDLRIVSLFKKGESGYNLSEKEINRLMQILLGSFLNLLSEILNKDVSFSNNRRDKRKCEICCYRFLCI